MRVRAAFTRSRLELGALIAAATGLWVAKVGYSFCDRDQALYLLGALRELDPTFARGDWITWEATPIHPVYTWLVVAIHHLTGEGGFAIGMFAAHLVSLALLVASLLAVSDAARWGRPAGAFALAVFVLLRQEGLGHAVLNHGQFLAADAALPFVLFACAAWLRGRGIAAGVHLGVAGLLHANYTAFGPLLLLGFTGLDPDARTLRARVALLVQLGVPFTVLASPSLWHIVTTHLARDANPTMAHEILRLRSAHHYYMDTFPVQDWRWMAWLAIAALPVLVRGTARVRRLGAFLAGVAFLAVLGNALDVGTLVRLYLWRLLLVAMVLLTCGAGNTVVSLVRARRLAPVALALATIAAFVAFAGTSPFFARAGALPTVVLGVFAVGMVAAALAGRGEDASAALDAPRWTSVAATFAALLLVFGHADEEQSALARTLTDRTAIEIAPTPPRRDRPLYEAIRQRIPGDARLLGPPSLVEARIQTRRAYFVDWKATPARGDEAAEWVRRMCRVLGVGELRAHGKRLLSWGKKRYAQRTADDLAAVAREEHLTHIISLQPAADPDHAGLALIARKKPYYLYAVRPMAPKVVQ